MKKTIRTKAHILSVPIKLYNTIVIYYIAMIGHRFINFIPEENSKSRFEQLLDLVTQLLNYTSGDADVALDWPPKPTNAEKSAQISLELAVTKSTLHLHMPMNRRFLLLLLGITNALAARSQQLSYATIQDQLDTSYHAKRITDPIKIDGILAEQTWKNAQKTVYFIQNFPTDTLTSKACKSSA